MLATLSTIAALVLEFNSVSASIEPKVASVPIFKNRNAASALQKRQFQTPASNAYPIGSYLVNVSFGTPPQTLTLQLDTGSSDTWAFQPDSCQTSTSECLGGNFDPNTSSSAVQNGQAGSFQITYDTADSGVNGTYYNETVSIVGHTLTNATIAAATSARHVQTGILGVGFDTHESSALDSGYVYPNIMDVMVSQGLINTKVYSLWLDGKDSATGTILFGGYDSSKWTGDLSVLPLQTDAETGTVNSFTVSWTSLTMTNATGSSNPLLPTNLPLSAVLDSGTSLIWVPFDIFSEIAAYFNVINVTDYDYGYLVPCNISSMPGSLDFGFGNDTGPVISVPFSELAVPLPQGYEDPSTPTLDGAPVCQFGLWPAHLDTSQAPVILGDTFLRSAYVVYDLDHAQVGIAQSNINASAPSNIQELSGGSLSRIAGASTSTVSSVSSAAHATSGTAATTSASTAALATGSGVVVPPAAAGQATTAPSRGIAPMATRAPAMLGAAAMAVAAVLR